MSVWVAALISIGKVFHNLGPATEKAGHYQ
jgi:hypothetical protein